MISLSINLSQNQGSINQRMLFFNLIDAFNQELNKTQYNSVLVFP